jgi:hypothetical protein
MPDGLTQEQYDSLHEGLDQLQQPQQDAAAVAAPGSAVMAQIPMPGTLQAPAPAAPNPQGGMAYGGGTPDQQLSSPPKEFTADTLNNIDRQKQLTGQQGDVESQGLSDESDVNKEDAAEKILRAKDFDQNIMQYNADAEDAHNMRLSDLAEYRAKAGSLKDPSSQFWEDKGQGSRITAALGAFASGLGGGLTGQNNGFLDFLHKEIDGNYQAHKQNIDDLYRTAVESGKIEDSVENKNRFRMQGKLASYELQSAHIKSDLEAVKNSAASKLAKITADKGIAGLDQEGANARSAYAQMLAKQGAGTQAAQRARQKEMQAQFFKQVELHNKDMGEDESRLAAGADLKAGGYTESELAPFMSGMGIKADANGQYLMSKADNTGTTDEPHYDENRKLILPTKTAQGKRIDPKELATTQKDLTEKTADVDGKPQIFRTKEDAEAYKAVPQAETLHATMIKAWNEGDVGTYNQAKKQFIELAPKLLGYKRGPTINQTGGEKAGADEQDRGTLGGQLPEMNEQHLFSIKGLPALPQVFQKFENSNPTGMTNSNSGQAINKLKGVRSTIDEIKKELETNLQTPKKKEETSQDVAVKIGLKRQ